MKHLPWGGWDSARRRAREAVFYRDPEAVIDESVERAALVIEIRARAARAFTTYAREWLRDETSCTCSVCGSTDAAVFRPIERNRGRTLCDACDDFMHSS